MNDDLREIEDKFLLIKTEREMRMNELEKKQKEKEEVIKKIQTRVKAIDFIEQVATQERKQVKDKVETLITSCLQSVYDDSYSVEFNYGVKGSRTSVEIMLVRKCKDGMLIKRDLQGIGGGVADSISLPLKLIVLLNDKEFDKILITDEPGKHLDLDRVPKFVKFIKTISEQLDVQIIMSSHHDGIDVFADSVNSVTINGSMSCIERIK